MTRSRKSPAIQLACLFWLAFLPQANAQCDLSGSPQTDLRTPLVNGASYSYPGQSAPLGPAEVPGSGPTPAPVTPGMIGAPTLIPSVPVTPGNIGSTSYVAPFNPAMTTRPGQLGPSMCVPPPPSTPGCDPGMVSGPMDFYPPPVLVTNVNPGGGMSGYAPTQRWGGQTTADFGRYKYRGVQTGDFGQGMYYGQTSQDGPYQQLPGAIPTQDLYGERGYTGNGPTVQTIAPY